MWSTFLTTLRINLREKSSLFWLFCFPILFSTMFLGMFGNLGATYEVTTMRFAMVANGDYCKSEGAQQLVAAMQRTPVTPQACDTAPDAMDVDSGVTDLRDLLDVTPVDNAAEATDLINTDTDVRGFLTVDGDGLLHMTISRATVSSVNDTMSTPGLPVSLSILDGAIGMFNRQALTVAQIMSSAPAVFTNEAFTAAVQEAPGFTRQVRLTNFKPDESARYYYALLAMTALMAMTFAVTTVCSTQANLSALGMRRSRGSASSWAGSSPVGCARSARCSWHCCTSTSSAASRSVAVGRPHCSRSSSHRLHRTRSAHCSDHCRN